MAHKVKAAPLFSPNRIGEQLALQGYERADVPRVQAAKELQKLFDEHAAGKITDGEFFMRAKVLSDRMLQVSATKAANKVLTTRVRHVDHIRAQLLEARRRGELGHEAVAFALWALDRNPALAENLAVAIRAPGENTPAGDYNPAAELIRLFTNDESTDTIVHEILHHAERMMPEDMQAAIRKEWSRALATAIKKGTPEQVEALRDVPLAAAGDRMAYGRLAKAIQEGPLNYAEHYPLVNPSEFWAVNGSRILGEQRNAGAGSIWQKIRQWLREMVQKVRALVGLSSTAPIIRALHYVTDASHFGVERGGRFESEQMLSDPKAMAGAGGVLHARRTAGFEWEMGERAGLFEHAPVPVTTLKGDELGASPGETRAGALRRLKALRTTGLPNADTGWTLTLGKTDVSKMAKDSAQSLASLKAIGGIAELAQRAVLAESHPDTKHENPDVQGVHRFYAPVEIGGVMHRVKLTVRDYSGVASGKKISLHALEAIAIEGAPLGTLPTPQLQPAKAVDESAQPTTARSRHSTGTVLATEKRHDGTLAAVDVRALDILDATTGRSVAESGQDITGQTFYSRSADVAAGTTTADLRAALEKEFGPELVTALEKAGVLTIADAPTAGLAADTAGVSTDGRIGLFAANTAPGSTAVAYHEALPATLPAMLGEKTYAALMARLSELEQKALAGSPVKRWVDEAAARIPNDTSAAARAEELAGYAVEQYQRDREALPSPLRRWVQDLLTALRAGMARVLSKAGHRLEAAGASSAAPAGT